MTSNMVATGSTSTLGPQLISIPSSFEDWPDFKRKFLAHSGKNKFKVILEKGQLNLPSGVSDPGEPPENVKAYSIWDKQNERYNNYLKENDVACATAWTDMLTICDQNSRGLQLIRMHESTEHVGRRVQAVWAGLIEYYETITTALRRTEPTQTFMSLTFPLPTSGNLLDRFDSFVYSVTKAVADQKDADPTACIPDALVITKLKQHLPKELQDYIVQLTSEHKAKDSATFIKEMRIKIDTKQSLTKDTAANMRSQHEKGEHSKIRTLLSQCIEEESLPSHLREEVKVFLASTFKPNNKKKKFPSNQKKDRQQHTFPYDKKDKDKNHGYNRSQRQKESHQDETQRRDQPQNARFDRKDHKQVAHSHAKQEFHFKGTCRGCGGEGHKWADCPSVHPPPRFQAHYAQANQFQTPTARPPPPPGNPPHQSFAPVTQPQYQAQPPTSFFGGSAQLPTFPGPMFGTPSFKGFLHRTAMTITVTPFKYIFLISHYILYS